MVPHSLKMEFNFFNFILLHLIGFNREEIDSIVANPSSLRVDPQCFETPIKLRRFAI